MNTLNIHKDKDYYFHEGTIALWEASLAFDINKGTFTSYAYSSIRGKLLNKLNKEARWQEINVCTLYIPEQPIYSFPSFLEFSLNCLTKNQRKWVEGFIFKDKRVHEIASEEGVSISAVKSWRREAIKKLKKEFIC